jgi:hypothetical protein
VSLMGKQVSFKQLTSNWTCTIINWVFSEDFNLPHNLYIRVWDLITFSYSPKTSSKVYLAYCSVTNECLRKCQYIKIPSDPHSKLINVTDIWLTNRLKCKHIWRQRKTNNPRISSPSPFKSHTPDTISLPKLQTALH